MMDSPATKAEFYRRSRTIPWAAALICAVIAVGCVIYFLAIASPPEQKGRNTKSDMRSVYAGIAGVFGVGMLGWAFASTQRWGVLSARGKLTALTNVSASVLKKSGARPVRISYEVDGTQYTIARDMPASIVQEIVDNPSAARVIYDPQSPKRAEVLSPKIAKLPDA
ncbi:MAG: hypothetical protein H7144_14440 [Burkholderiales bacterium]|nr:hypothetical protein [Phycisphaerae bacterium]